VSKRDDLLETCEWCGELLQSDGTYELKCSLSRDGEHPSLEELNGGSPGPGTTENGFIEAHLAVTIQALNKIVAWELPATGKFWPKDDGTGALSDRPMSYGACWGSNGERNYFREVAAKAIIDSAAWPEVLPVALADRMAKAILAWSQGTHGVVKAEYELNAIADILKAGVKHEGA
jgi:hypothetical protein